MELFIKNMVCDRCISAVERIGEILNLNIKSIELGKIDLEDSVSPNQLRRLKTFLDQEGMPLLSSKDEQILNGLKNFLQKKVGRDDLDAMNLSRSVEDEFGSAYRKLNTLFVKLEGKTVNQYFIEVKIERAKELLSYNFHTISEISYLLNYSSPQHLSRQFKKITGMSPSEFKIKGQREKIDKI